MDSQRVHTPRQTAATPGPGAGTDADAQASERLAAARESAAQIFAKADAILGRLRETGAQRFLDQARQSGGQ